MLDNTRENLRQKGKRINEETYKWDNLVDSIYKLACATILSQTLGINILVFLK